MLLLLSVVCNSDLINKSESLQSAASESAANESPAQLFSFLFSFCIGTWAGRVCRQRITGCRLSLWRQECHVILPAPGLAAGPTGVTAAAGAVSTATCRLWWRRQGGCRHWWRRQVVFFDKKFERWSFLTLRWRRWSLLSKILDDLDSTPTLSTSPGSS
jgi:hypothetical protein